MSRLSKQFVVCITLASLTGCGSNSLFSRKGKLDLDSTYAGSTATAEYPAAASKGTGILAAANYESADKLIEKATAIVRSTRKGESNKLIESRSLFQRALKQRPGDSAIHHQLAILSDKLEDFSEAERHYNAALEKKPNNPNLLSDLGYSYFLQKNYTQAEKTLLQAMKVAPDHNHAAVNLGAVNAAQGNYDEALSWFQRGGTDAEAQRNLAEFFPNGRPSAANIASTNSPSKGAGNPFEGGPAEQLLSDVQQTTSNIQQTANNVFADAGRAAQNVTQQLPTINAGPIATKTQTNQPNPFENGFGAQPMPKQFAQTQQTQQPQNVNPFANMSQPPNNGIQQVGYDQPVEPEQWPHAPRNNTQQTQVGTSGGNRQQARQLPMQQPQQQLPAQYSATQQMPQANVASYSSQPVQQQPANTQLPIINSNQLPVINPAQTNSIQQAVNNVTNQAANGIRQVANGVAQRTEQFVSDGMGGQMPKIDRNAQIVGMNAGPGGMFPVTGGGAVNPLSNSFDAQVDRLQQNARNMIPQPNQNIIHNATAGMHQQADATLRNLTQQGANALNQIPQASYETAEQTMDGMRDTLGGLVNQYQSKGGQLQQQGQQQLNNLNNQFNQQFNSAMKNVSNSANQTINNVGQQLNNTVQQVNPFENSGQNQNSARLPIIVPGRSQ